MFKFRPYISSVLFRMVCPLSTQVLHFNDIDCPMAIGYMLALQTAEAYEIFRRTIRLSKDDYGR